MTAARSIPATITVDRSTRSIDLPRYAQFENELNGSEPYVRLVSIDVPCAPSDLLPKGSRVERCITTDTSVSVLARLDDATLTLQTFPRWTLVQISAVSHERAEQIAGQLRSAAPRNAPGTTSVRFWYQSGNCKSPTSEDRAIEAPSWDEIAKNYPVAARRAVSVLAQATPPGSSGKLILWHGPPGTGKTTALRALIRRWSSWCQPQYIADPEVFFAKPSYLTEVLTTAPVAEVGPTLTRAGRPERIWRLIIAEDSDEYLRASARRDAGAALGRLLNLADGILGHE